MPRHPLSSPRVHFQVRVLSEAFDLDQDPSDTQRFQVLPLFGFPIPPPYPPGSNDGLDLVSRSTGPQRGSQVEPLLGVEAQVPRAVSRLRSQVLQRSGRGGDDAEHRPVWEDEPVRRCPADLNDRLDSPVPLAQHIKDLRPGEDLIHRPLGRSPYVHVLDETRSSSVSAWRASRSGEMLQSVE